MKSALLLTALILAFCLLYLVSTGAVAGWLFTRLVRRASPVDKDSIAHEDSRVVLIVVGAGTCKNAASGRIEPSEYSYGRIFWAARIYQNLVAKNSICDILITGKGNLQESEASVYKKSLVDAGVAPDRIILEDQSANTWQNAQFTALMLKSRDPYDFIYLLTSGYHLARCCAYFRRFLANLRGVYTDSDNLPRSWKPSYLYLSYSLSMISERVKIFIHDHYYWKKWENR